MGDEHRNRDGEQHPNKFAPNSSSAAHAITHPASVLIDRTKKFARALSDSGSLTTIREMTDHLGGGMTIATIAHHTITDPSSSLAM